MPETTTSGATLLGTLRDRLLARRRAIVRRAERGDYGRCETCGDPIEIERLEVLPTARLCTTCAEATERDAKMTMAAPRDEEV